MGLGLAGERDRGREGGWSGEEAIDALEHWRERRVEEGQIKECWVRSSSDTYERPNETIFFRGADEKPRVR